MMSWRILVSCKQLQETIDLYRSKFSEYNIEMDLPEAVQQLTEAELVEIIHHYDGVIAGDDFFTSKVLERGKRLKVIAKWGIGVDNIDLDTAERLGIQVINTPNVFADEVSDVAMGYLILLARGLHRIDQSVREGGWLKIRGTTLRGKTMGVVGLGSIGQALTWRVVAHGMVPIGFDIVAPSESFITETGLRHVALDELLRESDFIAFCCNLTPENRHMLNDSAFGLMKDGVRIINVARGPLIDEQALVTALRTGKVAGAALDVFEKEPLPETSPLREFDNCIFGTHNGSNTLEGVLRTNEKAIGNLLRGLGLRKEE